MERNSLIRSAHAFALQAHRGQRRPNTAGSPFSTHFEEVADLVILAGGSVEETAAAYLHDVLEDTETTESEIEVQFGCAVSGIVTGLTDGKDLKGMPTLQRKKLQAERLRSKSTSVKLVKIADQTSNIRSVAVDPPIRWSKAKCLDYIAGAKLVADECRGASVLLDRLFEEAYAQAIAAHQ